MIARARLAAATSVALVALVTQSSTAMAHSAGQSSPGCMNCHGSGEYDIEVTTNPRSWSPGAEVTVTVTITPPSGDNAGVFVAANEGTLGALGGQGLAAVPAGLTHTSPKGLSGGDVSFTFEWTAPNEPGAVRFDVSTLVGNGNGSSSGDQGNHGYFDFVYGCSPATYFRDFDGDGYGTSELTLTHCDSATPAGYASAGGDCNDSKEGIYPGAVEYCNQQDDDCDSEIDDDAIPVALYPDADGDGYYGNDEYASGDTIMGCVPTPGYGAEPGDCQPENAAVNPGVIEVCNLLDDNCDTRVDEYVRPRCGEGWCEREAANCDPSTCVPGDPVDEVCNLLDDNCDGIVDEGSLCPAGQACVAAVCTDAPAPLPEPKDSGGCSIVGRANDRSMVGWLLAMAAFSTKCRARRGSVRASSAWMRALLAASLFLASCSSGGAPGSDDLDGPGLGGSLNVGAQSQGAGGSGGADGSGGRGGDGGNVAADPPIFASTHELCKLINDVNQLDPTANATHTRANVQGTDLGIPVAHGSDLYLFFGDTVGYKAIWPFSESVPDAVGFAADGRSAVAADPSALCNGLSFLRVAPGASVGPTVDAAIEADFAAGAMTPPGGQQLSEYIKNPSGPIGQNAFPALPGTFEVPSGAFSHGGSIYAFYTTVESPSALTMKASYLAKWSTPSTSGTPHYDILHRVDERFSGLGPLGGNFINIAAEPSGAYLYMFGTGEYRESAIHLARKSLASLDAPGGYEVFDAASGDWLAAPATSAAPIISEPTFGETSFRYFPERGLWMFMAQANHRVVARFANQPEGPWSSEITIHDNSDPAFQAQYCCSPENNCSGEQLFNCSIAGFYGTYLLPDLTVDATGFSVGYTMSTWSPYNVALFSARFDNQR